MALVKRLKAAYDICSGSDAIEQRERDRIHFYQAVRSIVFKLTRPNAPDAAQMNARVREMIAEALKADGVEEIFRIGNDEAADIFDEAYLAKIDKIKLPNTRVKLLQQLLARAIDIEEKAFYDILKGLTVKYDFSYAEDKLLALARAVKDVVDDKVKYTDWSQGTVI